MVFIDKRLVVLVMMMMKVMSIKDIDSFCRNLDLAVARIVMFVLYCVNLVSR